MRKPHPPKPRLVYKRGMWRCMITYKDGGYTVITGLPGWGKTPRIAYLYWKDRNNMW